LTHDLGIATAIAAAANSAPDSAAAGHGRLAFGGVVARDLAGVGARMDWQLRERLKAFALGELGYSPLLERWDWRVLGGLELRW
jgi:hypothetical protein